MSITQKQKWWFVWKKEKATENYSPTLNQQQALVKSGPSVLSRATKSLIKFKKQKKKWILFMPRKVKEAIDIQTHEQKKLGTDPLVCE